MFITNTELVEHGKQKTIGSGITGRSQTDKNGAVIVSFRGPLGTDVPDPRKKVPAALQVTKK